MTVKPETDPRHAEFRDLLGRCYRYLNDGEEMPWDGSDAKKLAELLAAKPDLTKEKFYRWLVWYAQSENINPAARPRRFLPSITDYASGPLNEYGRPLKEKKKRVL